MASYRYEDVAPTPTPRSTGNLGMGSSVPRLSRNSAREQATFELQHKIQEQLVRDLAGSNERFSRLSPAQTRQEIEERLQRIIDNEIHAQQLPLTKSERLDLFTRCIAEITGYGPIDGLLHDENVTEIMVNGPYNIWIDQRKGGMVKTDLHFKDDDHLLRIIERIVSPINRRVNDASPLVDARLRDGSRVNIVVAPVALDGSILTIRKFATKKLQPADLVEKDTVSRDMMLFLQRCVEAKLNIIVSGGTNTGKSTLLNVLSVFIPSDQRIVTIEDAAELQLQQAHVVRMESRPANVEGKNQITIRQLVANALRQRPDRIIVGECRGGEALDMLQAMNTGHEGSMTTIHANTAKDVLNRLQMLVLMSGIDLPERAVHEQILSAVHLIVQLKHFEDNSRRVVSIAELRRGGAGGVEVVDIFAFEPTGKGKDGRVLGRLRPTGERPRFLEAMEHKGLTVPPTIFKLQ
ncbi:MAG: CpaF family protein [Ktedonobacterales bacterium]|nr:CpaF family protein [Ktedonobacterales bacterium]